MNDNDAKYLLSLSGCKDDVTWFKIWEQSLRHRLNFIYNERAQIIERFLGYCWSISSIFRRVHWIISSSNFPLPIPDNYGYRHTFHYGSGWSSATSELDTCESLECWGCRLRLTCYILRICASTPSKLLKFSFSGQVMHFVLIQRIISHKIVIIRC